MRRRRNKFKSCHGQRRIYQSGRLRTRLGEQRSCEAQAAPLDMSSFTDASNNVASNTLSNTGSHTSSGGHFYTGHYFGPSYFDGQREATQRNFLGSKLNNATANVSDRSISRSVNRSVSRGGFGSSSRGFSGGG